MSSTDPSDLDQAPRIVRIAHRYQELATEGAPWAGGPIGPGTLHVIADALAHHFDARTLLAELHAARNPAEVLHGALALAWAQGFNVGTMYADPATN